MRLAVGATLRRTLLLYRAEWRTVLALALLVEVPVLIANAASVDLLDIELRTEAAVDVTLAALVLLAWSTLAHHVLIAAMEQIEACDREGRPRASLGSVVRDLPYARLLLADLLVTLAFLAGLVLLVVPGILVAVWTAPVFPLLRMERRPVLATIRRSFELVRGNAWRVFAILAVVRLSVELGGVLAAALVHDSPALDAAAHFAVTLLFEPVSAGAVVVATFSLVEIDAARRHEAASPTPSSGQHWS